MTNERAVATTLAAARIGIGVVAVVAPGVLHRWIGPRAEEPEVKVMIRAVGARDVAIGVGALVALDRGDAVAPWLRAGVAADAADLTATLVAFRHLPRTGRWLAAASAASGAAVGLRLLRSLP